MDGAVPIWRGAWLSPAPEDKQCLSATSHRLQTGTCDSSPALSPCLLRPPAAQPCALAAGTPLLTSSRKPTYACPTHIHARTHIHTITHPFQPAPKQLLLLQKKCVSSSWSLGPVPNPPQAHPCSAAPASPPRERDLATTSVSEPLTPSSSTLTFKLPKCPARYTLPS